MQDRNDMQEIMQAALGAFDELAKKPMPEKATSRTIAILPDQGEIVKLRGLDFVVSYVNKKTGKLHLEVRAAELPLEPSSGDVATTSQEAENE